MPGFSFEPFRYRPFFQTMRLRNQRTYVRFRADAGGWIRFGSTHVERRADFRVDQPFECQFHGSAKRQKVAGYCLSASRLSVCIKNPSCGQTVRLDGVIALRMRA